MYLCNYVISTNFIQTTWKNHVSILLTQTIFPRMRAMKQFFIEFKGFKYYCCYYYYYCCCDYYDCYYYYYYHYYYSRLWEFSWSNVPLKMRRWQVQTCSDQEFNVGFENIFPFYFVRNMGKIIAFPI